MHERVVVRGGQGTDAGDAQSVRDEGVGVGGSSEADGVHSISTASGRPVPRKEGEGSRRSASVQTARSGAGGGVTSSSSSLSKWKAFCVFRKGAAEGGGGASATLLARGRIPHPPWYSCEGHARDRHACETMAKEL